MVDRPRRLLRPRQCRPVSELPDPGGATRPRQLGLLPPRGLPGHLPHSGGRPGSGAADDLPHRRRDHQRCRVRSPRAPLPRHPERFHECPRPVGLRHHGTDQRFHHTGPRVGEAHRGRRQGDHSPEHPCDTDTPAGYPEPGPCCRGPGCGTSASCCSSPGGSCSGSCPAPVAAPVTEPVTEPVSTATAGTVDQPIPDAPQPVAAPGKAPGEPQIQAAAGWAAAPWWTGLSMGIGITALVSGLLFFLTSRRILAGG